MFARTNLRLYYPGYLKTWVIQTFLLFLTFITGANNVSRELSLHPVHLTPDKKGNLPPSAFVPFCSYQGESDHLGRQLPEMNNMIICDKFQPTILEGQLCYTLDLTKLRGSDHQAKSGKTNGLFLLVDPFPYHLNRTDNNGGGYKGGEREDIKVFIHTLAQYSTLGPGSYAMSTLKKITGTASFKELPQPQRKCIVHNREDCQTRKYMEQVRKECNCIPWTFKTHQAIKTRPSEMKVSP